MSKSFLTAKEQEINDKVLATGVCNVQVVAINPDKEELSKIINKSEEDIKEPSYPNTKDNKETIRLDFWMKPVKGTQYYDESSKELRDFTEPFKMAIFLSNEERVSSSGNKLIINGKVQTTWASSVKEAVNKENAKGIKWFDETSAREAKEGEDQLYNFFAKYANINLRDDETNLLFEDYDKILDGDVSELRDIIESKNEEGKSINVLLGVHNGIYQEVYSNEFARGEQKSFSILLQKAVSQYGGFRADFGNQSVLKSYVRPSVPRQAESAEIDKSSETDNDLFG